MLQEPRGETGFRAGLPRGAQRVSLAQFLSISQSGVFSVTAPFSDWLICGWKTVEYAFNLHQVQVQWQKGPHQRAHSLSGPGWILCPWLKITEMRGALHCLAILSYIIHLSGESWENCLQKERKDVIPKEGVMVGGWSGNNEWPQYRCSFVCFPPHKVIIMWFCVYCGMS